VGVMGALSEEKLNGVQVHRVGGNLKGKILWWLKRGTPPLLAVHSKLALSLNSARVRIRSFIKIIYDLTWKKLYWPESTCLWFFFARSKALNLTKEFSFDAIISTSTPYTGHLVGKTIKQANPNIPWTVDIGDPFSLGEPAWNNVFLYSRLNYRSEAEVLNLADSIVFTVETCKKAYTKLYPGIEDKVTVIPPLFSGVTSSNKIKTKFRKGRLLVFAGSLYKGIRNPTYLLKLLSGVFELAPETEVHFYGRINDCASLFEPYLLKYPKNIFIHGLVDRRAAADAMDKADILINIANRTLFQLPSKLVDYMASGKPILNIISIEDDNSVLFLSSYVRTVNFMECPSENINHNIEKFYRFIADVENTPQQEVEDLLQPFLISSVEAQYQKIIYQLAHTNAVV